MEMKRIMVMDGYSNLPLVFYLGLSYDFDNFLFLLYFKISRESYKFYKISNHN